MCPRLEMAVHF